MTTLDLTPAELDALRRLLADGPCHPSDWRTDELGDLFAVSVKLDAADRAAPPPEASDR